MSDNLLEVSGLSITYETDIETVYAVNDVSFTLKKGESLGIVGETGAGKTTTALSILRVLPQRTARITGGKIFFDGIDLFGLSDHDMRAVRGNRIAMIFQDPMTSLNPVLTVGEQIAEVLELHHPEWGKQEVEDRVDNALKQVGIPPFRKKEYPHQFSGGMKQRVVIAMALACEPDLLIADEPTTALDVTIQAQVLNMIRELRETLNTSLLLITHDFGVVAQTCDRVAVMYAGEFVELGTAEDVFCADRHHPYTEGLFGSIPRIGKAVKSLVPIPGSLPDPTKVIPGCCFYDRCQHGSEECRGQKPPCHMHGEHMIKCTRFPTIAKER